MIKQRYIRHQAINKQGEVVAIGYEVAKKVYPFGSDSELARMNTSSTEDFLFMFSHSGGLQDWKRFIGHEHDKVRFTKAIVYVG